MTNTHPYPHEVVEAVAKGLYDDDHHDEPWEQFKANGTIGHIGYYEYAQAALTALWEVSRVDSLEQLDALPNDAVLLDVNGVVADDYVTHCIVDLPAHIIHWGDEL